MKLSTLHTATILEIWRWPTRHLYRVNAGTVRASQSDIYSSSNLLNPKKYESEHDAKQDKK